MGELKKFSQTDPQWKKNVLGFDNTSTIGEYGCLLTSITMLASNYGFGETPASLNDKLKAIKGFQGAFLMPYTIGSVMPGIVYKTYVDCKKQPAPVAEIDIWLAMGKPVIIEVDWSPQAEVQTHYMVVYGKKDGDYLIQDPYPFPVQTGEMTLGGSKYATIANTKDPSKIITGVMYFDGPAGAVKPPAPPKLDTGVSASFKVYATADDLAIRSQTMVSDATLLKRVPINTELTVLEADAAANPKIGQMNQWLAVKTPDGTDGYTAAWYVTKVQPGATGAPVPGTTPQPVPIPKDAPVVKTTTDGLKLRSRPDNTDATILKMLPLGAELKVLETAAEVKRKVGVNFEWLKVADVQGTQGSVAAWYVSIVSLGNAAFGPESTREPQPPSFSVGEILPVLLRTTEEKVALRSEPYVSAKTLILRMPLGTELIAIEDPDLAAPKIGEMGQWIHVKDVAENEGYVAGWCVEERPEDPVRSVSPADS